MINRRHLFRLGGALDLSALLPKAAPAIPAVQYGDEAFALPDLRAYEPTAGVFVNYTIRAAYSVDARDTVPVGTIFRRPDAVSPCPAGWLLCDGRRVARRAYPDLFKVIGHIYG